MAAPQRELDLNSAFEKADRLLEKKAYRQTVSLKFANNIIIQLMFAFTGRNKFISMGRLWRQLKNSKTTYLCLHLSIYDLLVNLPGGTG
jgi:hypothetical protein